MVAACCTVKKQCVLLRQMRAAFQLVSQSCGPVLSDTPLLLLLLLLLLHLLQVAHEQLIQARQQLLAARDAHAAKAERYRSQLAAEALLRQALIAVAGACRVGKGKTRAECLSARQGECCPLGGIQDIRADGVYTTQHSTAQHSTAQHCTVQELAGKDPACSEEALRSCP
jgi:hypothetical protein